MKYCLSLLLILLPAFVPGQAVDSAAIKKVDSLIQLSRDYIISREYDKAMEASIVAEKIAIGKIGDESAEYGYCCFIHGRIEHFKKKYEEAEKWYLKSQPLLKNSKGKYYAAFITSKTNLAELYKIKEDYESAEKLYLEYLPILREIDGKESYIYNATVHNFANLYNDLGYYEKAEPLYLESLNNLKSSWNENAPYVVMANLGNLYLKTAQYEKAEKLYREALPILKKTIDEHPIWYAGALSNLAKLNEIAGNYGTAEMQLIESLSILRKTVGKADLEYALTLSQLAGVYTYLGQYDKAEEIDLEVLSILENTVGREHIEYVLHLKNMGFNYEEMGNYEKAESLFSEVSATFKKQYGAESQEYAESLIPLASINMHKGDFVMAGQIYFEAAPIVKKAFGISSPEYVHLLIHIGTFYSIAKDDPAKMDSFYQEALNIQGGNYIYISQARCVISNQSEYYLFTDQFNKAEEYVLKLQQISQERIEEAIHHLSEDELNKFVNLFSIDEELVLSFTHSLDRDKLIKASFNTTLFYKGFLLESANRLRKLAQSDSLTIEKYNRLKSYQRLLANHYSLPDHLRDSAQIALLELKANDIEKDLARTVAGFENNMRRIYWQDVQNSLQPGEIAMEFVNYDHVEDPNATANKIMYAALILRHGDSAPSFIPLFEEKQLDSLLHTSGQRKADYVNSLYTISERGGVALDQPQKSLYYLIWEPLSKVMEGVETIYFSPTGLLHRLNLAAIPLNDEESLGDHYKLVRLNSTRQLVIKNEIESNKNDALVYGGIAYEMDSTAIATVNQDYPNELITTRGDLSFEYTDSSSRGDSWNYLSWTDKEVDEVGSTLSAEGFNIELRKGYSATEESFKFIGSGQPSPRVIHLATHGYFFPDPKDDTRENGSGNNAFLGLDNTEPVFKISEHPMIRSGLILAGGNHAWKTGKPISPGMEDGILTAYEISQMDLSNTELVVLSACETGLGDIEGNEGVYGLQRAFKIAGVKYLIMSLWQVPDRETMEFMKTFYSHWLEDEMEIPEAFRATQLEMRDRFLNPYAWAGFVLVE